MRWLIHYDYPKSLEEYTKSLEYLFREVRASVAQELIIAHEKVNMLPACLLRTNSFPSTPNVAKGVVPENSQVRTL
eukprot:255375-Amphidinium_carterae.1